MFKLCSQILDVLILNVWLGESPIEVLGHCSDLRKRADKSRLFLSIEWIKVLHISTERRRERERERERGREREKEGERERGRERERERERREWWGNYT